MTNFRTFLLIMGPVSWLSPVHAATEGISPSSIQVYVDQSVTPLTGARVIVPSDAKQVRFLVSPPPGQVRYELKGWDKDWNQRLGEAYFVVRFISKSGDQVGRETYMHDGTSPGWNKSLTRSTFTERRQTVIVPPDAERVSVGMSSAGPAAVVGIFAVTDVNLVCIDNEHEPIRSIIQSSFVHGHSGNTAAFEWHPSGPRPSMTSKYDALIDGRPNPVFVITDTDIKGHADWNTVGNDLPAVTPGEILEVRWKEIHSLGMGDPLWASYGTLAPGNYQMVVEQVGITGTPLKTTYSIAVKVPLPLWKNSLFWLSAAVGAIVISVLVVRRQIRKKFRHHVQQTQLIADERLRIARDLHDDLGARLSHISLLGSHAESAVNNVAEARVNFEQISSMSRELIIALSQTVWMLSSKNDKLDALIDYLCRLVSELCRPSGIRCRIDALPARHDISITSELRHNISLAFKEAVNNALKHSAATEIQIKIRFESSLLKVHILDDGKGLSQIGTNRGNGLDNIRQRMKSIHGKCSITEMETGGVSVYLEAPIR